MEITCQVGCDKSEMWVIQSDLKNSHLVEVAEFAQACKIDQEPAFMWQVLYMLKKIEVIVSRSSMNARAKKQPQIWDQNTIK